MISSILRDNLGEFERTTAGSASSIQGKWADAIVLQTVADALNSTIQIIELI